MIINKTPHRVIILDSDNRIIKCYASLPPVIRINYIKKRENSTLEGVPICRVESNMVENLPDPQPGIYYIVSSAVKTELSQRYDLLTPSEIVRDDYGNILGCKSLRI